MAALRVLGSVLARPAVRHVCTPRMLTSLAPVLACSAARSTLVSSVATQTAATRARLFSSSPAPPAVPGPEQPHNESQSTPPASPGPGKKSSALVALYNAPYAQAVLGIKRAAILGSCGLALVYLPLLTRQELFANPTLMLEQFYTTTFVCIGSLFCTAVLDRLTAGYITAIRCSPADLAALDQPARGEDDVMLVCETINVFGQREEAWIHNQDIDTGSKKSTSEVTISFVHDDETYYMHADVVRGDPRLQRAFASVL
eukprot:m.132422 g.132422  ORF g.132422 m.132422 type:complete len:258 (+) comp9488_c1_seq2:27-800(+)